MQNIFTVLIHTELSKNTIPRKWKKDCPLFGTLPKGVHHFGKKITLQSNADHGI